MCLVLVAHAAHPRWRFAVAANRDEFHARPAAPAGWWDDAPGVLAGRDLESGGTWLGVARTGRFATVTNVRAGDAVRRGPRSRGLLVTDFLSGSDSASAFVDALAGHGEAYDGFNLLAWDGRELAWYSNRVQARRRLYPGVWTLSNADLDTRWPKTERLRGAFAALVSSGPADVVEGLMVILRDSRRAPPEALPDTGVGAGMESVLSPIFIEGHGYGTRCSTVLLVNDEGHAEFCERRYDSDAQMTGQTRLTFDIDLPPP